MADLIAVVQAGRAGLGWGCGRFQGDLPWWFKKLEQHPDNHSPISTRTNAPSAMVQFKPLDEDWRDIKRDVKAFLPKMHPARWGPKTSGVTLVLWFLIITSWVTSTYYSLPDPVPATNLYRFSEERARQHVKVLSRDIGTRMVGTAGEDRTIHYLVDELKQLQSAKHLTHPFELSVTRGSGQHLFELINVPIVKTYHNVTNIAVRIPCDDCASDKAVIVNTHFDGMMGSNGAADAATPVAIMIDTIRFLTQSQKPTHPWFKNVVAVVNLEAAGIAGKSVLFQSKSQLMLDAYAQVSSPHGSSMANDLFKSGLLISDTDYKQFMEHGDLPGGLDMAIYQHSYLYHTKLDREDLLPPGVIQHFGQNTLDILKYLAFEANLDKVYEDTSSDHAFFDFLGMFFVQVPGKLATNTGILLAIISFVYLYRTTGLRTLLSGLGDLLRTIGMGLVVPLGIALGILTTDYRMLWFNDPSHASLMYGFPVAYGMVQGHLMGKRISGAEIAENAMRKGLLFLLTVTMCVMIVLKLQTAFVFAILVGSHLVALLLPASIFYHVSMTLPILVVQPLLIGAINTFVPLTGRMGPWIPAECSGGWLSRTTTFLLMMGGLIWFNFFAAAPRNTIITPKRMVLLHTFDADSHQANLHLIKADTAPYPRDAVQAVINTVGTLPALEDQEMSRDELFVAHQALAAETEGEEAKPATSHYGKAFAPRLRGIKAVTHAHNNSRTITIPCRMNEHNHVTVFRFTADVASASAPIKPHGRSGSYFIRQSVGGYGGAAEKVAEAGHDLEDKADAVYEPAGCDFSMVVQGTEPLEIHAAAMTPHMGETNVIMKKLLPLFSNATDVMAVDAVHRTIVV
ncbi:hypothetical protein BCR44DRAFT_1496160 [Catenaria anguillulae PL171]|uniref:Peptide hydrolase n=1 Tax=Catenaria anguillulae PL171 TaxID=765915 RepID=A0A1Y2I178_9FUNG|nr:hypothetical protein BCR44DRAFT_1496160 [Catenaria anguillulae PL171]